MNSLNSFEKSIFNPTANGTNPKIVAEAVRITGVIRVLPASTIASKTGNPFSRSKSVNSTSNIPFIILIEILFSIIGVFLGFSLFKMQFSIVMSGVGIIALAGIVVRNGILLVEFTDLLREKGLPVFDAIVEAGKTRMTPVILTASATILGLVPLAVGLNIDFSKLFSEFNPHIYFGGDNTAFWGPLSWTMIFGLSFATFLTLIMVPVMYLTSERLKNRVRKLRGKEIDTGVKAKKIEELTEVEI